jgi:acetoin utilization protein AcuC
MMADPVVVVYGDEYKDAVYDFGSFHPLQPIRVELAIELMRSCGLFNAPGVTLKDPRPATRLELTAVHAPAYVDAVETLGAAGAIEHELREMAEAHGFAQSDNPVFLGMGEASALVAGGTIVAAETIMNGSALHAFAPAGGLHHAHYARAAGFCIYNDPAVAIAAVRAQYGGRVIYIDVDAHHGDGVQELFYDDPNVLTFSMHESGRYLFPGTGFIQELGEGRGYGYSVNVPLEPYTSDEPFLRVVDEVILPLARAFRPDLIVTQCGCDSHWLDPLTHLAASTHVWPTLARSFHDLAHEVCGGRWLATGGGGYDLYSVVPRAWTLLLAGMVDTGLPDDLPADFLELRRRYSREPMSTRFLDAEHAPMPSDRRQAINAAINRAIRDVHEMVFPLHGL